MNFLKQSILLFTILLSLAGTVMAQGGSTQGGTSLNSTTAGGSSYADQNNAIMTAVPFLAIVPDARGGAMGDAGVSSTPDANSMHFNAAKLAFIDKDMGLSISYSPWLHKLVQDINLAYLSAYKRIDKYQVVGLSLRYFNLGAITFTDETGYPVGNYNPNEFAVDGAYSRLLSKTVSMSVSARYIHSNLTLGQYVGTSATKPGNSVAADIGIYQQVPVKVGGVESQFSWGASITNLGAKISYSDANLRKDFLPTNLRFGPSLKLNIDDYNSMAISVDVNKLLVPTLPFYQGNSDTIIAGVDPNVSPVVGLIHSFYDAPGGFSEEMKEYSFATGLEYWYDKQFAVRGGFFYEDKHKGNRKFVTLGAGLRYSVFGLDFSYLISLENNNPLANTLRFSLVLNFDNAEK
ncbi:MAG: type IX secretion system outer membrane channel protein PorV [Bacteroidetes bacterium]|nr:type IX secretion system outer membrane channel protein PorV [Bacteroidota bacterium]